MELLSKEVLFMNPEKEKRKRLTIEEHDAIQKQYPNMTVEYYSGEIIMSSHASNRHNNVVLNICTALRPFFKGTKCKVRSEQIEIILGYNTDNKEFVFPDVFVACDRNMRGESFIEIPQIIFEVVSENYRDNDYIRKLKLYTEHGVLEYIIVDPYTKTVIHYYKDGDNYQVSLNNGYTSQVFEGLKISLEDIFEE